MSTLGRSASYSPDLCELAHDDCLLGATNDELAAFFGVIDDIARLDAAGASVRHAGDCAGARPLGETVDCTPWVRQQNPGQMVDHWSCR
jgi:hypothetical protein